MFWPPYVGPKFQTEERSYEIDAEYEREIQENPDMTKHPLMLVESEVTRDFRYEAP